jgi:hypothetical protein
VPFLQRRIVEEQHRGDLVVRLFGVPVPVGVVLVPRVRATDEGSLEVQLLGEEVHFVFAENAHRRLDEPRVVCPLLERLVDVGERLDPVNDVAVALPFDRHARQPVGIERVGTDVIPLALRVAVCDEVVDQRFARGDDRRALFNIEHSLADDVTLANDGLALGGGKSVTHAQWPGIVLPRLRAAHAAMPASTHG